MRPVRNKPARVDRTPVRPGGRDLAAKCGIDRVRGTLEESIEVIPPQHMRCPVGELVIGRPCQVELPEQPARVVLRSQNLGRRHLKRRHLGVRQVVTQNRALDIRAQRKAAFEEDRTARRALRHRPHVSEANTGVRNCIDVRRQRRRPSSIAEDLHLVDPNVIHDDEMF